ncbi:MAG: T9SS type A sorting domain-containing protein [Bacteroidota bacterium]|nr:T9SS type A sorting domain-containing protein [Bacteroidota bacterium]
MKLFITFLLVIFISQITTAQLSIVDLVFTYDAAGNQLLRKTPTAVTGGTGVRKENTDTVKVESSSDTSLTELLIYPNPVSNILHIKFTGSFDEEPNLSYTLIDINGKIVAQNKVADTFLDENFSNLSPGYYILNVLWNKRQKRVRLIKE